MFFSNINLWIPALAAIVAGALGFVWYAPWAFGKLWIKSMGLSHEEMAARKKAKEGKPMWPIHLGTFIATLATAFVLAALFNSLVVTSVWGLVMIGFLMWLGFSAPVKFYDFLFAGDSFAYFAISAGYELVAILAMSLIIGIFG